MRIRKDKKARFKLNNTPTQHPVKKKPRKPAITNGEVLTKLVEAGVWTVSDWKSKTSKFHTIFEDHSNWWDKVDYQSFMIPVDIYKKHVARFAVQIPKGALVRLRSSSTRANKRSTRANFLGDTNNWAHLGIGTGNRYIGKLAKDIMLSEYNIDLDKEFSKTGVSVNYINRIYKNVDDNINKQLLIGNKRYALNAIPAYQEYLHHKKTGNKKVLVKRNKWWYNNNFSIKDFIKKTEIKGDGIFGPKTLINGTIREVYVHFLWNKWEKKREARYLVYWENGTHGIFTSDYLERVYDYDYDTDDHMYVCPEGDKCTIGACTHRKLHMNDDNECNDTCHVSGVQCEVVYDLWDLPNMCSGKGLEDIDKHD